MVIIKYEAKFGDYNQFTQYSVVKKTDGNKQNKLSLIHI